MIFDTTLSNNSQSIVLSIVGYILYGVVTLLSRYVLVETKISPCSMLVLRSLLVFIGLVIATFTLYKYDKKVFKFEIPNSSIFPIAMTSIVMVIAIIINTYATQKCDSIAYKNIYNVISIILVTLGSVYIFKEYFSLQAGFGICLTIIGLLLVTFAKSKK